MSAGVEFWISERTEKIYIAIIHLDLKNLTTDKGFLFVFFNLPSALQIGQDFFLKDVSNNNFQ